jgi:hypothetical protein
MATLGANVLTLTDWAKRVDPNGQIADIIEILDQSNELLADMGWIMGNLPTGHRTTIRTGLPAVYWRRLNQGIPPSKSTTAQVDDQCGSLEKFSEVDSALVKMNDDQEAFRLSEAFADLEALAQEMAGTLFYGNHSLNPEEFNGLSPRYSDLAANNAQNIIDAGGTGSDNCSVWLIGWSERTITGIFPKGSQAGIEHQDLGEGVVETTAGIAGNRMMAFRDHYIWKAGITVRDWRYAVRICNIDVSDLVAGTGADLIALMIRSIHRIPSKRTVKLAFYMNRTCIEQLDVQRRTDVAAAGMTYVDVDGHEVPHFRGIPIRTVDQLVLNEGRVT